MTWLSWIGLAALITAVAAVTGLKAKETRHVSRTRLMGGARLALFALALVFGYLALQAYSSG